VSEAVEAISSGNHDLIIAVGGGSPIDTAKAASILARHGGSMKDYKAPFEMNKPGIPIVAIPTTAGTGSEVTKFTVVTDSDSGEKMLCMGPSYVPEAAIVDYQLTFSKPARLTADTAIDSLTHAIEAFVSKKRNPFSSVLAMTAMSLIPAHVVTAYREPNDAEAREALMLSATYAGIAFSNASVALVHGMSRPLGAHFHIPHGLSNAMLLPIITEWSIPGSPELYAECARAIGIASEESSDEEACQQLMMLLRSLCFHLEVPSLEQYGIDSHKYFSLIPLMAEQAIASGSPANNPRVPNVDQVEELYHKLWEQGAQTDQQETH
jgi:alcohol dehydrogenase